MGFLFQTTNIWNQEKHIRARYFCEVHNNIVTLIAIWGNKANRSTYHVCITSQSTILHRHSSISFPSPA